MSTTIQVLHVPNPESTNKLKQRVYYRVMCGEIANIEPKKVYAADIMLHREVSNPGPFAEQLLLEYLVSSKQVIGPYRVGFDVRFMTGCTLLSQVANGGHEKSCAHPQMIQHRHMFSSRFFDSFYEYDPSTDWIDESLAEEPNMPVDEISQNQCNTSYVKCKAAGSLVLTHHALSRYQERRGYKSMSRAWSNIVPLLEECKWSLDSSFVMDPNINRVSETWQVKGIRRKPFLVVTTRQGRDPLHRRIVTIMNKPNTKQVAQ